MFFIELIIKREVGGGSRGTTKQYIYMYIIYNIYIYKNTYNIYIFFFLGGGAHGTGRVTIKKLFF